jgi:hypothetical protein
LIVNPKDEKLIIEVKTEGEAGVDQAPTEDNLGLLPTVYRRRRVYPRKALGSYINFYDLAYHKAGGGSPVTVPMSVNDPLDRATGLWADMIDGYNFPLSIPLADWKKTFIKMGKDYRISAFILGDAGIIQENILFTDTKGYKLPDAGNVTSLSFNNNWLPDPNSIHTYYEDSLFDSFGLGSGWFDYWTDLPDKNAPRVIPNLDLNQELNLFMAPRAIRVTGEYFSDAAPGSGGSGAGASPWRPMPYPQYYSRPIELTCEEYPAEFGSVVYYRQSGGLQFSRLPNGGVQPPFGVCGLGTLNPDGTYSGFTPDEDRYDSPTAFLNRANVFDSYLDGTLEDDGAALRERMVAVMRLQGGANIIRRGGVWGLGPERDAMTNSRHAAGGRGSTELFLYGAVNQGSKWFFRWRQT